MNYIRRISPETVVAWALGFVVGWFGTNEILFPADWAVFAPSFLGTGSLVLSLVVLHGIILVTCAVLLLANFHRRIAGGALALIFIEIISGLIYGSGLSDIAVRDIGLCGASISLALTPSSKL
jgi:hypothetical protein